MTSISDVDEVEVVAADDVPADVLILDFDFATFFAAFSTAADPGAAFPLDFFATEIFGVPPRGDLFAFARPAVVSVIVDPDCDDAEDDTDVADVETFASTILSSSSSSSISIEASTLPARDLL